MNKLKIGMAKNTIRLTESELKRVIAESVKSVIKEIKDGDFMELEKRRGARSWAGDSKFHDHNEKRIKELEGEQTPANRMSQEDMQVLKRYEGKYNTMHALISDLSKKSITLKQAVLVLMHDGMARTTQEAVGMLKQAFENRKNSKSKF